MDLLVKTFESVAARGPQAVAVEGEASSVTYAALNGLANGVAAELVNRGIAPGQIAGIWLPPGIGYVSAFLGVLKAGGAVMPIDPAVAVREGPGGEGCLWAYVVCAEHIDPRELRRFLEDYLPAAMMPETFIQMDRLPVSSHGKVDRASLPADAVSAGEGMPVSAQSETEEALAQIWFRSLGLQNVDVEESFLNLGGDSLKAMRAISAVYKVFGVEITLASLFRQGTIRNLARLIDVETSGRKGAD